MLPPCPQWVCSLAEVRRRAPATTGGPRRARTALLTVLGADVRGQGAVRPGAPRGLFLVCVLAWRREHFAVTFSHEDTDPRQGTCPADRISPWSSRRPHPEDHPIGRIWGRGRPVPDWGARAPPSLFPRGPPRARGRCCWLSVCVFLLLHRGLISFFCRFIGVYLHFFFRPAPVLVFGLFCFRVLPISR